MDTTQTILFVAFLSVVLGIYYIVPKKGRFIVLSVFSLAFYIIYSKFMTIFIVLTIVSIYFAGRWMNKQDDIFALKKEGLEKEERKKLKAKYNSRKKIICVCFALFNLLILATLKYFNFFTSVFEGFLGWFNVTKNFPVLKLALPLGISYYTLSSIGYLVDVFRGKYRGEGNFFKVALFVLYFPQLIEGPFANFDKLAPQLYEGGTYEPDRFMRGFLMLLWGTIKKVVIADRMAIIVSEVFANYSQYSGVIIIVGILAFTFQLYAEFSGIIDAVRGVSLMFGIELNKNFEQPFFSQNVSEFWRRWHISLGAWFREYVFYSVSMSKPLTKLNKKLHGKVKPFFEVFIPSLISLFFVWFFNGLWHGPSAKYIVYGLYYYVIMMFGMCIEPLFNLIYKKLKIDKNCKAAKISRMIRTFIIVNLGLMMFRADNMLVAGEMFTGIFSGGSFNLLGFIDKYDLAMCVVGIVMLFVYDAFAEHGKDLIEKVVHSKTATKIAIIFVLVVFLIVFGAYGDGYIPVDPIYGGF